MCYYFYLQNFEEFIGGKIFKEMIEKLSRTAEIITLKLRKRTITPEVERESKTTQRNNQYQNTARNIAYYMIYLTTYDKAPDVIISPRRSTHYGSKTEYTEMMISNMDKYMKHFISLIYEKFADQLRKIYGERDLNDPFSDVKSPSVEITVDVDVNDDVNVDCSSDSDDEDTRLLAGNYSVNGSVQSLKPIDFSKYANSETSKNQNIVKKLYLNLLMELTQSKLLAFLQEKIENKHYAQRAVMEVLRESCRRLSKKGVAHVQRIQYMDYIDNLLKQQCYKDVADKLQKLALDLEFNCFRYTDVVNPQDDCTPIDLKHFEQLARFTSTIYGYSTQYPIHLTTETHIAGGVTYDIVKFTRDGESEIFDVRAVNRVQLDFKSWKERLNSIPNEHLPQSYIKIIPHKINKVNLWSGRLKDESDKTYLYVRTSGLGRGTLFMNIGKMADKRRNKSFPVLNTRHKKLKKDHLYDGDVENKTIDRSGAKIEVKPLDHCSVTSSIDSEVAYDVSDMVYAAPTTTTVEGF